jgi:small-conductance mechanosensitive channel
MIQSTPISDVLRSQWYHNSLQAYLIAGASAIIIVLVLVVARRILVSRIGGVATRTTNSLDDMIAGVIRETRTWVIVAVAIYFASAGLVLPVLQRFLAPGVKLAVLWQAALWGGAAITFWLKHYMEHRTSSHDRASIAMITAMGVGAKVLLWVLLFFMSLKTVFGIEITALITGLGVGGIAVALAVQNILGDLLAALAIVFDKPFDVGDPIGVDQVSGTVEHIGLKTTRIRSLSGEQIIIGNGDLLKSRLRNYKRMSQRRVVLALSVPYDTPVDVLATLPGIVEQIITAQSPVKFDRCHIASLGDSAIGIEAVYNVLDPDYTLFMNIQQAVDLDVLRRFAAVNVKLALPSRTVYHEGARAAS